MSVHAEPDPIETKKPKIPETLRARLWNTIKSTWYYIAAIQAPDDTETRPEVVHVILSLLAQFLVAVILLAFRSLLLQLLVNKVVLHLLRQVCKRRRPSKHKEDDEEDQTSITWMQSMGLIATGRLLFC